jgi:TolB-like protein
VTDRPSLLEFGPYRIDGRRRLVWKGETLLDVPPKAAELLAVLASEAGQVVPKEELLRRVWPDTFVEEANLSVNVSILRKALGDQADGRPWIQTVPRRGYRFLGAVRVPAAAPRSLAVLPFRSLGGDEADDALGLGMADALITRLAGTGRVAVRPTGTIRRFAGLDVDPSDAGRQLGVDAVLDGRLQRSGTRLRLTLQLVPTTGGAPLWAERFDEEMTHLFAVEDKVAERVAVSLVAELSPEERQRLGRRQTESLGAYQAYCRGRFFWGRFSRPWVEKAMLSFHEATALDPRYALPHAGLADAFLVAGFAGALAPREAWALAGESCRKALALDDRLPEPHVSAGFLRLLQEWDWDGAERELRRASELAPESAGLTSGSVSCSTFAAAATKRHAPCVGRKTWTRCPWSSLPSSASTTPSPASTRPSSPRRGALSSSTRPSSSATGRSGAPCRTSAATTKRWGSTAERWTWPRARPS